MEATLYGGKHKGAQDSGDHNTKTSNFLFDLEVDHFKRRKRPLHKDNKNTSRRSAITVVCFYVKRVFFFYSMLFQTTKKFSN